jgi:uncharacterized protein (DUF433 family)
MILEGRCAVTQLDARRFDLPLYTIAEAARIVAVPPSTLASWARGYERHFRNRPSVTGQPIISCVPAASREPSIPFVGLAEALVLAAFRRSGVPMQRIRPAVDVLSAELGVHHALASRRLYTDGAEVLFDYGERNRETDEGASALDLVVVRSGQRVFVEAVAAYLSRIEYGADDYASLIHVPAYQHAAVVADPERAFGAPIFERGGARVDDVLERFWAGESLDALEKEFGVPIDQLEDVLRAASRRAA